MQLDCIAMLKEGVAWDDVHLLAHKIAIDGLLALGVLKGDKEEILKARTSAAFLPHGLGHYLGMDTHDTGGHPNYADPDPLFRFLRVRRNLPANSVITVEPGVSVLSSFSAVRYAAVTNGIPRSTSAISLSAPISRTPSMRSSSTRRSSTSTGMSAAFGESPTCHLILNALVT